jgi:hypothetical protein
LAELSTSDETPDVHPDKLMDALIMCRRIVNERYEKANDEKEIRAIAIRAVENEK